MVRLNVVSVIVVMETMTSERNNELRDALRVAAKQLYDPESNHNKSKLPKDYIFVGSRVEGVVTKIEDFGYVVSFNGSIEWQPWSDQFDAGPHKGLVHRSQLNTGNLFPIDEVVSIGQKLTLVIIDIDRTNRRVSLSEKFKNAIGSTGTDAQVDLAQQSFRFDCASEANQT
jgi:ribosomal protein S1